MIHLAFQASCAQTAASLSAWVDGELRGVRRLRVARHLARCEHCRAVLRGLGDLLERLRALGGVEPAAHPDLADAVVERISRERGDP